MNDRSTDKTKEFLEKQGFRVIPSHPKGKNLGKGGAVMAGVKYFANQLKRTPGTTNTTKLRNATIVILDADIMFLKPEQIETLTTELRKRKLNMVIAKQTEGDNRHFAIKDHSGSKAIRMDSFTPFLAQGKKTDKWIELTRGMGLEIGLNALIPNNAFSQKIDFQTEDAFRVVSSIKQATEMQATRKKVEERKQLARQIMSELDKTKKFRPKGHYRLNPETITKMQAKLKEQIRTKPHLR